MGRTQRALTSLVAAIPAGFLAYLLVMVFLNKAGSLTTITQVLVGLTLVCAALVTLMPFGLLIFGGKKAAVDDDDAPAKGARGAGKADADEVDADDESVEAESGEIEESGDSAEFALDESDDDIMADSDDDISGPASSLDEIESLDYDDDDDEEEEPAPKKRKR